MPSASTHLLEPLVFKLALLVAVFMPLAFADWWAKRHQAQRWREYGFLCLCGTLGAGAAAGVSLVTAHLAPAYFVYGKGAPEGEGLAAFALAGALEAGFTAGAVAAGCLLIASSSLTRWPRMPIGRLWRSIATAATGSLAAGVLSALLPDWVAHGLSQGMDRLPEPQAGEAALAFKVHLGSYVGLTVTTALTCTRVLMLRRKLSAEALRRVEDNLKRPGDDPKSGE